MKFFWFFAFCFVSVTALSGDTYLHANDCLHSPPTFHMGPRTERSISLKVSLDFVDTTKISGALDDSFPGNYSDNIIPAFMQPENFMMWRDSMGASPRVVLFFDTDMSMFQVLKLSSGQGPFESAFLGNVFWNSDDFIGLMNYDKLMVYHLDRSKGDLHPMFSTKLPQWGRKKHTFVSVGKSLVLFPDLSGQLVGENRLFYRIYSIDNHGIRLLKEVLEPKKLLKSVLGPLGDPMKNRTDIHSLKLMMQKDRIVVVPGFQDKDFYFYNPVTGVFAHFLLNSGKLMDHTCWDSARTNYETKTDLSRFAPGTAFSNNSGIVAAIHRNMFTGEIWILRKAAQGQDVHIATKAGGKTNIKHCPTWDVYDMRLHYSRTVRLQIPSSYEYFRIYNFLITGDKRLLVFAFVKKWGEAGIKQCVCIRLHP